MGMADVVPGVSGGTIAFISGIYSELIESIKSVDATALRLLGTLLLLLAGMGGGFAAAARAENSRRQLHSFARLLTYLAELLDGAREGEQVIAHPDDRLREGVRVETR